MLFPPVLKVRVIIGGYASCWSLNFGKPSHCQTQTGGVVQGMTFSGCDSGTVVQRMWFGGCVGFIQDQPLGMKPLQTPMQGRKLCRTSNLL
nr:hypothetical protein [Tanacetum cinerariifolium]